MSGAPKTNLGSGHFWKSCPRRTPDRVTFGKVAQDGPRIVLLSEKLPKTDPGSGHFQKSCPRRTPARVTFGKVAQDGPRIGSLSEKLPKTDLGSGHFWKSCPRRTPDRSAWMIEHEKTTGMRRERAVAEQKKSRCIANGLQSLGNAPALFASSHRPHSFFNALSSLSEMLSRSDLS